MRVSPLLLAVGMASLAPIIASARPTSPFWATPSAWPVSDADDPPKKGKATRQGTPTGEVQGGTGGREFRDKALGRLTKITVRADEIVDAIRCTWDEEGGPEDGINHGGLGGSKTIVTLEPGEALVQVSGTVTQGDIVVIGSLSFKTTKRTIGPIGGSPDGKKFTLDAPKGQEICGFQGRNGDYLDAIGLVCRPLP